MRDFLSGFIAIALTLGFLGVIGFILVFGFRISAESQNLVLLLIGSLTTNFGLCVGYFYGSSAAVQKQSETVAKALDKATPNITVTDFVRNNPPATDDELSKR